MIKIITDNMILCFTSDEFSLCKTTKTRISIKFKEENSKCLREFEFHFTDENTRDNAFRRCKKITQNSTIDFTKLKGYKTFNEYVS